MHGILYLQGGESETIFSFLKFRKADIGFQALHPFF